MNEFSDLSDLNRNFQIFDILSELVLSEYGNDTEILARSDIIYRDYGFLHPEAAVLRKWAEGKNLSADEKIRILLWVKRNNDRDGSRPIKEVYKRSRMGSVVYRLAPVSIYTKVEDGLVEKESVPPEDDLIGLFNRNFVFKTKKRNTMPTIDEGTAIFKHPSGKFCCGVCATEYVVNENDKNVAKCSQCTKTYCSEKCMKEDFERHSILCPSRQAFFENNV